MGNEMDGPWQMGHKNAQDYGQVRARRRQVIVTDPNIKLVAAGSSNYSNGIDWIGWNRTVLDFLKTHADYLALHMYVGNAGNDGEFLTSSLTRTASRPAKVYHAALSAEPRSRKIYIAWTNGMSGIVCAADTQRGRRILEERYNLEDALVVSLSCTHPKDGEHGSTCKRNRHPFSQTKSECSCR